MRTIKTIGLFIGIWMAMMVSQVHATETIANANATITADDGAAIPNYYRNREDGWFWYKDPPPPPKPQKIEAQTTHAPAPVSAKTKDDQVRARFEEYKKNIETARIKAFFEPTPQNLKNYAELQTDLVNRSSEAADVWQRVIWANPQFDYTQERPVNRIALDTYERNASERKQEIFARLAATQVLYFFFRSDCPYCHQFAPTLARFSQTTGIRVFPITLDGAGLPDYPRPQLDNGIARNLGVTSWPAVFLADPAKGKITPVGFGVMSDVELADRLVEIEAPPSAAVGAATPVKSYTPTAFQ